MAITTGWNPQTYDEARRRLVPCFDFFYGTVSELILRTGEKHPRILDLAAGTGLLAGQVVERVKPASLTLFDGSTGMLEKAQERLVAYKPTVVVGDMTEMLPPGEFDVVMSSLAIHHLSDTEKRALFARIHGVLAPGGIFVNAEQVLGADDWEQTMDVRVHLDTARALGSSDAELAAGIERMKQDRCTTLDEQVAWLREVGFARSGVFFHWFGFAVYAGWKAPVPAQREVPRAAASTFGCGVLAR